MKTSTTGMLRIALAISMPVAVSSAIISSSHAAPLNVPVPKNAYLTVGGLDWAWASPCNGFGVASCGPIDLTYQSTQGWRLPTPAEFASHPSAQAFAFPGANVPANGVDPVSGAFNGTAKFDGLNADMACAAPYFGSPYVWCDWLDGAAGHWFNPATTTIGYYDTLVVRETAASVPEPTAWAMLIAGFGVIGSVGRRRNAPEPCVT